MERGAPEPAAVFGQADLELCFFPLGRGFRRMDCFCDSVPNEKRVFYGRESPYSIEQG